MIAPTRPLPIEVLDADAPLSDEVIELVADLLLALVEAEDQADG